MSAIRFPQSDAMMTTKFMPGASHEDHTPWLPQQSRENQIRMNWAVVTDHRGIRQLRLHWNARRGA